MRRARRMRMALPVFAARSSGSGRLVLVVWCSSPGSADGGRCGVAVKGALRPAALDGFPPHRRGVSYAGRGARGVVHAVLLLRTRPRRAQPVRVVFGSGVRPPVNRSVPGS